MRCGQAGRIALSLLLIVGVSLATAAEKQAGGEKAAVALRIHIISGSGEYKSEPSLREFKKFLEDQYRVEITASWSKDGAKRLENLEPLAKADLMLIFARRLKLGPEQMKLIRGHWEQGKPIVALRTAGHAFSNEDNKEFDLKVLGGHYKGHYGGEPVKVTNVPEQAGHPVLKGVGPFTSKKLYKTGPLPETTTVLQIGDIGKAKHAVTIVSEYKGRRVFFTSTGVPEDFQDKNFRRMLLNAIFWTTRRDEGKLTK